MTAPLFGVVQRCSRESAVPCALSDGGKTTLMYEGDSFFTLSLAGRLGLVALSTFLAVSTFVLAHLAFRLVKDLPPVKRLGRLQLQLRVFSSHFFPQY